MKRARGLLHDKISRVEWVPIVQRMRLRDQRWQRESVNSVDAAYTRQLRSSRIERVEAA